LSPGVVEMIAPLRIQTRPAEIARATGLLCLSLAIGAVKVIFSWRLFQVVAEDAIGFPFILTTFILALNVLLIWKIWQGRNWARTTLLVVFIIGLMRTATALVPKLGFHASRVLAILQIVQLVIYLYALLLVYGSKAQSWFQPKETQAL
jgi:CDP-diglyceride synthetase